MTYWKAWKSSCPRLSLKRNRKKTISVFVVHLKVGQKKNCWKQVSGRRYTSLPLSSTAPSYLLSTDIDFDAKSDSEDSGEYIQSVLSAGSLCTGGNWTPKWNTEYELNECISITISQHTLISKAFLLCFSNRYKTFNIPGKKEWRENKDVGKDNDKEMNVTNDTDCVEVVTRSYEWFLTLGM